MHSAFRLPDWSLRTRLLLLLVALAVGWQWFTQVDRTTSSWVLLAALSLLMFHAATSLAASAPAAAPLGVDLLRPAGARFAVLAAVTLAVWLAVRVSPLAGHPAPDALTVVATLLLLVPLPVFLMAVSVGIGLIGGGIYILVVMPWALKDIWKQAAIPIQAPGGSLPPGAPRF